MSLRISVIMPVYNAGKYLKEAVQSILDQSFSDFELLIYNDGSKDDSLAILESFDDPRIQIISFEENQGLIKILNLGLEASKGEFIARMDADDISYPDRFQKQIDYLEANPECGMLGTQLNLIGTSYQIDRPLNDDELRWWIFKGSPLAHPSVMLRNSIIQNNQLKFNANAYVAEDFDLWWRMANFCQMANLKDVLLDYRIHQDQESSAKTTIQSENFKKSQEDFIEFLNLKSRKWAVDDINNLLSRTYPIDYSIIKKTQAFFDDLLKSESALKFFGRENIERQYESSLQFAILNIEAFRPKMLKLLMDERILETMKRNNIHAIGMTIKCLLYWKTR